MGHIFRKFRWVWRAVGTGLCWLWATLSWLRILKNCSHVGSTTTFDISNGGISQHQKKKKGTLITWELPSRTSLPKNCQPLALIEEGAGTGGLGTSQPRWWWEIVIFSFHPPAQCCVIILLRNVRQAVLGGAPTCPSLVCGGFTSGGYSGEGTHINNVINYGQLRATPGRPSTKVDVGKAHM